MRRALILSGLVLFSQAWPLPSPVFDAATFRWVGGFHMIYPAWHLLLTPFCSVADYLTAMSLHQLAVFVVYVAAFLFLLGGWRWGTFFFACFVAFIAWATLVPRPMGRLVAEDPETLLVDFHSHSQYSHDGRSSFTPQANEDWHARQGYNAAFITDHNRVEAADIAKADSTANWKATGYRSLKGEEISLKKTHLVILGNREKVDNRPYDSDFARIPVFIADMRKKGVPVIASLPEYWWHHWETGVQDFIRWGVDGFEIINSAPKALDFPPAYRRRIVDLCRQHDLFMTGISDNHGYGYATAAWNALSLPGWSSMDPDRLEKAILLHLRNQGFKAVTVMERSHYRPETRRQLVLSPLGHFWYYWRSLTPLQAIIWCLWIWVIWLKK